METVKQKRSKIYIMSDGEEINGKKLESRKQRGGLGSLGQNEMSSEGVKGNRSGKAECHSEVKG